MKKISERLEAILTNFHLTKMEMLLRRESGVTEWRQTAFFTTESKVYGREGDTDKIIDFLTGYVSHAQLIFKHERIINYFELRIWVRVSEDFRLKSDKGYH